jgi:hypothetical protein
MDRGRPCRTGLRRPGRPPGIRDAVIGRTNLRLRRPGRPRGIHGVVIGRNDRRGRRASMSGPPVGGRLSDDDLLREGRPVVHRVVGSASTG